MKRFKRHYDFKLFGFHIKGMVSTYKWGYKRKHKPKVEQQELPLFPQELSK